VASGLCRRQGEATAAVDATAAMAGDGVWRLLFGVKFASSLADRRDGNRGGGCEAIWNASWVGKRAR
jgi:hypothetical protein